MDYLSASIYFSEENLQCVYVLSEDDSVGIETIVIFWLQLWNFLTKKGYFYVKNNKFWKAIKD